MLLGLGKSIVSSAVVPDELIATPPADTVRYLLDGNSFSGLPTSTCSIAQFAHAAFYVDLLAEQGSLLGEPYTKQLDGKLRELRFYLGRDAVRVTYWIASGRRIILLTVFRKTRMRENREVERARRALVRCQVEAHTVDEEG